MLFTCPKCWVFRTRCPSHPGLKKLNSRQRHVQFDMNIHYKLNLAITCPLASCLPCQSHATIPMLIVELWILLQLKVISSIMQWMWHCPCSYWHLLCTYMWTIVEGTLIHLHQCHNVMPMWDSRGFSLCEHDTLQKFIWIVLCLVLFFWVGTKSHLWLKTQSHHECSLKFSLWTCESDWEFGTVVPHGIYLMASKHYKVGKKVQTFKFRANV